MIGGCLLLGLQLLAFGFLFISLTTNVQTEMYTKGNDDYLNGSFSPAAAKLKKYLEDYPNEQNSSRARVLIQMASLHEVLGDPEVALERSRTVLAAIVGEEQFRELQPEFIVILPDMYEAFVDKAIRSGVAAEKQKLLDQAAETLKLINNDEYILSKSKETILKRLKSIEEKVDRVKREIEEDADLVQAVAAIEKALAAKQTSTAWQTRRGLLARHRGLRQREELLKATEQIITAERALVSVSTRSSEASKDDPTPAQAGVAGATVSGSPIPALEGEVAYVLVGGTVYGIDVATGKPLWQRALGKGTNLRPIRISNDPGADGLISDVANKSLMRVKAKTGEVVWRANIGVEFALPIVDGERIVVSSQAGVLAIDAITGASSNLAEFPLPLSVGVCHDPQRQVYYQIADNSNLYAISKDSFECSEVYYVGHRAGQVVAPPVTIVGLILVPQNLNAERSLLRVLKTNESGLRIQQAQTTIQLEGRIIAPPVVFGHRVLVVTDRRGIHVFDIEVGEQTPVYEVATIKASEATPRTMFPLVKDSHLWVGSNNISKYVVQASKQQIVPQFTESDGDYLADLQSFGNFVLDVRRPKTRRESINLTLNALGASARAPIWETSFSGVKTSSTTGGKIQVANR